MIGFIISFVLGVLMVFVAMYSLKKAKSGDNFNMFSFLIPYCVGVVLSFAG